MIPVEARTVKEEREIGSPRLARGNAFSVPSPRAGRAGRGAAVGARSMKGRLRRGWGAAALAVVAAMGAALAAEPAAPAKAGGDVRPAFKIGVGDRLEVFVFGEATPTECLVRPDGRITRPLAGDVQADGATPTELAARIKSALEPFQKDPTITVAVREINSYRVYMLGNVRTQMAVVSTAPLRLLQALAVAGGLNEFADKDVAVLRGGQRIVVSYSKIIRGETPEANIWLETGDVVVAQ